MNKHFTIALILSAIFLSSTDISLSGKSEAGAYKTNKSRTEKNYLYEKFAQTTPTPLSICVDRCTKSYEGCDKNKWEAGTCEFWYEACVAQCYRIYSKSWRFNFLGILSKYLPHSRWKLSWYS